MKSGTIIPFDPLSKRNLGESISQALLRQPVTSMAEVKPFGGAGIYAIYYCGSFPAYELLASKNRNQLFQAPVYIGKAAPRGTRKGGELELNPGNVLFKRLLEHKRSIEEVDNLNLEDFFCRYLVVDDIWISLGESLLIARFDPLWNSLVDGFGNHDPGKGRHSGKRPRWDVLHSGRPWANQCQPRDETSDLIVSEVRNYLANNLS